MVISFSYDDNVIHHPAVAISNMTAADIGNSANTGDLLGNTTIFLRDFLPILTAINIPLSLTNFLIFVKLGFQNSPSNFIYFNLVIVDLMNSAVGFKVSLNLWNDTGNMTHFVAFWGDQRYAFERYVNNFTFVSNIVLVFGLCLIRILWLEMSALRVLGRLKTVSVVMVILAYSYGSISCVYRFYLEKNYTPGSGLIFQSLLVEVKDIFECLLVVVIILMSIFIHLRIWRNKSKIEWSVFKAASSASLIITANVLFSYAFWIITVGVRVYYVVNVSETHSCPGSENQTVYAGDGWKSNFNFKDFLLCDELYISIFFMCLHCTINSFILLFQRHTRRFLRNKAKICLFKLKRVYRRMLGDDESDYAYL